MDIPRWHRGAGYLLARLARLARPVRLVRLAYFAHLVPRPLWLMRVGVSVDVGLMTRYDRSMRKFKAHTVSAGLLSAVSTSSGARGGSESEAAFGLVSCSSRRKNQRTN